MDRKPVGFIDQPSKQEVSGWVAIPGNETQLSVEIVIDGTAVAKAPCNELRRSTRSEGIHPTGLCGFRHQFDSPLATGTELSVREESTGWTLNNCPTHIDLPASNRLYFMHIAKTAGSSLNHFIAGHYRRWRVQTHVESTNFRQRKDFATDFDFISGHVRALEIARRIDLSEFVWVTLLREPIAHLASHLRWVRQFGADPSTRQFKAAAPAIQAIAERLQRVDLANPTELEKFLDRDCDTTRNLFDNCQTRYFVAPGRRGQLTQADLKQARATLKRFEVVGLTDRYDQFVAQLCERMGWEQNHRQPKRLNVQKNDYGLDPRDQRIQSVLTQYVAMDLDLYREIAAGTS